MKKIVLVFLIILLLLVIAVVSERLWHVWRNSYYMLTLDQLKNADYSGWKLTNGEFYWDDIGTSGKPTGIKGVTKLDENNVVFGDLNSDGLSDAVVVLLSGFEGLELHSTTYVFINNKGQPKALGPTLGGREAAEKISGISSFKIRLKSLLIKDGFLIENLTLLYFQGQQHYIGGQYSNYTGKKIDYKYALNVYESNPIALKYKVSGNSISLVD